MDYRYECYSCGSEERPGNARQCWNCGSQDPWESKPNGRVRTAHVIGDRPERAERARGVDVWTVGPRRPDWEDEPCTVDAPCPDCALILEVAERVGAEHPGLTVDVGNRTNTYGDTGVFTLAAGDAIEIQDNDRLRRYVVETVAGNGAVMARNVDTGKKREFPGYGRIIRIGEVLR